jgi:hypothetical protein
MEIIIQDFFIRKWPLRLKRRCNKIDSLFVDGVWCTNSSRLQREASCFFQIVFSNNTTCFPSSLRYFSNAKLPQATLQALLASVSKSKVFDVVRAINRYKASGPDGFHPIFFKHF